MRELRVKILLLFTLFICADCYSQSVESPFYKKDFIIDDEVFRITANKNESLFQFNLDLGGNSQQFDLVNLETSYIFSTKLRKAIETVVTAKKKKYKEKSEILNDSLSVIVDSITNNRGYILPEMTTLEIKNLIESLSAIKGCDSVFFNRPLMEHVLHPDSSEQVHTFFEEIKKECNPSSQLIIQANNKEFLEKALSIFSEIQKNSLVEKEEASIAGIIYVKSNVQVCIDNRKDKETHDYLKKAKVIRFDGKVYETENQETLADYNALNDNREEAKQSKKDDLCSNELFKIDSVQFEFEHGKLQNVKALGKIGEEREIFGTAYPLSFSTKEDGNISVNLYSVSSQPKKKLKTNDLFLYDYNLLLYTENYSPKDQVLYIKPGGTGKVLVKEKNTEILKTKVFTDLVGLNDKDPNGLIQLEFSKRLNLWTKVNRMGKYSKNYISFFNSIEPIFTLNKIEDDDNSLPIITIKDKPRASYNDILRYRKTSLGVDLNLLKFGLPGLHSSISINTEFNHSLADFAKKDTLVTTMQVVNNMDTSFLTTQSITEDKFTHLTRDFGFALQWDILPSTEYQFSLRYSYRWFKFFPKDDLNPITPFVERLSISSNPVEEDKGASEQYHTFQFLAQARLSRRGDLFFRGRYHFLNKNVNQNYFQIQFGYSYFFFSRNN